MSLISRKCVHVFPFNFRMKPKDLFYSHAFFNCSNHQSISSLSKAREKTTPRLLSMIEIQLPPWMASNSTSKSSISRFVHKEPARRNPKKTEFEMATNSPVLLQHTVLKLYILTTLILSFFLSPLRDLGP